jgi:hypothetical protein
MEAYQGLFQQWSGRFATEPNEHWQVFPREHRPLRRRLYNDGHYELDA